MGTTKSAGKPIGLWIGTSLVVGNMIGSGIFLLPASLAPYGTMSLFGWGFSSVGAILLALSFARLGRRFPLTGGPYAFTRVGFGDFAGFLVAWGYWLSICAGNAAIAVALVGYLSVFFPRLTQHSGIELAAALGCVWALTWINAAGVRPAGRVQLVTAVAKLVPLVAIGTAGLLHVQGDHFLPINPSGMPALSAVTAAAALTLWGFLGLESATIPAHEIEQPERTIPLSTILGTAVAAGVYVLATVSVLGVIPSAQLAQSTAPFADAARTMWGAGSAAAVAAGGAVSCFGALNGWILLQGQIPFAAAADGIFPKAFARLSPRGTPVFGLSVSSLLISGILLLNYTETLVEQFTFIILLSTLTVLVPYLFCTMTQLRTELAERQGGSRGRQFAGAAIPALAFAYSLWAVAGAGRDVVYWGFLLLMSGLPVYVGLRIAAKKAG